MALFNWDKRKEFNNNTSFNTVDYSEEALKSILNRVVADALIPIQLKEEKDKALFTLGSSFLDLRNIKENEEIKQEKNKKYFEKNQTLLINSTLQQIVVNALYNPTVVVKCKLTNSSNLFLLDPVIDEKTGEAKLSNISLPILNGYSIDKVIYNKELLLLPFKQLSNLYNQIEFFSKKSNLIYLKKDSLNSFANGKDLETISIFLEEAKKTFNDFLENRGGIIDAKDEFGIINTGLSGIVEAVNFANMEISRMLGIPHSILTGENPSGLNSGGIVDFNRITYEKRLNYYRQQIILPLLDALEVNYVVSGFSNEEKLSLLKDFSTYSISLEASDDELFNIAKDLIKEIIN